MYTLYFDKNRSEIKITKAKKVMQNLNYTDNVERYNNCLYICMKRKPLVEKAKEIRAEWIAEAKENLAKFEAIEIK